jgi:hypothetical protein
MKTEVDNMWWMFALCLLLIDVAIIIVVALINLVSKQMFDLEKAYCYIVHYDIDERIHSEDLRILVKTSIYNKKTVLEMMSSPEKLSQEEILFIYGLLKKAEKYDKTIKVIKRGE